MGKHQLFKNTPPIELVIKVIQCFGFEDLNDKGCICKKYFGTMNVIDKLTKLLPELRQYYLPCKAKAYLNELTNNSVLTILRQMLRPHNYVLISREKYINREKLINYNLENKNEINLQPIKPEVSKIPEIVSLT